MPARLTPAEARALGLPTPEGKRGRAPRRQVVGEPYRTRCVTCDEQLNTRAAEDRHVAPGHIRFELVLS